MSKFFSMKNLSGPKRRKQRIGGFGIIIFAVLSLFFSGEATIEDMKNRPWLYIITMLVFCLIGVYFIFQSAKPDPEWEAEQAEKAELPPDEETVRLREEVRREDREKINKYLE